MINLPVVCNECLISTCCNKGCEKLEKYLKTSLLTIEIIDAINNRTLLEIIRLSERCLLCGCKKIILLDSNPLGVCGYCYDCKTLYLTSDEQYTEINKSLLIEQNAIKLFAEEGLSSNEIEECTISFKEGVEYWRIDQLIELLNC